MSFFFLTINVSDALRVLDGWTVACLPAPGSWIHIRNPLGNKGFFLSGLVQPKYYCMIQ